MTMVKEVFRLKEEAFWAWLAHGSPLAAEGLLLLRWLRMQLCPEDGDSALFRTSDLGVAMVILSLLWTTPVSFQGHGSLHIQFTCVSCSLMGLLGITSTGCRCSK